jgi:hypothetical protein
LTILIAGGEDTSFALVGTTGGASSGSTNIRTAYARVGLNIGGTGITADPPTNRWQTPAFAAQSTLWFHAQFGNLGSGTGTTSNAQMIRFLDGGTCRIIIRGTGTAGQLKISTRNNAGTITDLATSAAGAFNGLITGPVQVDVKIIYSVSGSVTVWIDSTQVVTYSGDVTTNSATTLDQVEFVNTNAGLNGYWSEVIVADADTRAMSLWTLAPQAAGNTQSWTPNTLGNINETTINDATLISTSSNNSISEWTTPTSAPSGTWAVEAIVQEARVQVGLTGPQHFDWITRTGGSDFTAGVSVAPTTSFSNFKNIWATNPNTTAAWAIGDIASGFNLGIKSLA